MKEKDNFWEIEERKDEAGLGNPKRTVCVIGHKNPDTDSICSAIAYAISEKSGRRQFPLRAGTGRPDQRGDTVCTEPFSGRTHRAFLDEHRYPRVEDMDDPAECRVCDSNISLKNAWNAHDVRRMYIHCRSQMKRTQLKGLITVK